VLDEDGGHDSAVTARVRAAWKKFCEYLDKKFCEYLPMLTGK